MVSLLKRKNSRNDRITFEYALNDPTTCGHQPYDTIEVIFEVATLERVVLEGVFFLFRREPDVLQKLILRGCDNNKIRKRNNTPTERRQSSNAGQLSTKRTKAKITRDNTVIIKTKPEKYGASSVL